MKKINGVNNFSINSPTILTLGTFDGVHKGHQKILKKLKSEAKKDCLKSVVLTFFPHPRTVLNPNFSLKLIILFGARLGEKNSLGWGSNVITEESRLLPLDSLISFFKIAWCPRWMPS